MDKLFIPILLGTNRAGRESEKAATFLYEEMSKHESIDTQWFDVRDFKLPEDDYGQAIKDRFPEYKEAVEKADGFVFVIPEYNRGYPGRFKSVIDTLLPEYNHKAVGIATVSAGPWGGARVGEHLLPVMRELGLVAIAADMYFPKIKDAFNEDGTPTDDAAYERAKKFLDEVVWMARSLKWGRENLDTEE